MLPKDGRGKFLGRAKTRGLGPDSSRQAGGGRRASVAEGRRQGGREKKVRPTETRTRRRDALRRRGPPLYAYFARPTTNLTAASLSSWEAGSRPCRHAAQSHSTQKTREWKHVARGAPLLPSASVTNCVPWRSLRQHNTGSAARECRNRARAAVLFARRSRATI